MTLYLGIDLGTSNSVIAGLLDGKMRLFRPADGGDTLPSMIAFDKRGKRMFGRRAHDLAFINPENTISGFKRLIGTNTNLQVEELDLTLTPEECSADIIRELLAQVTTELGDDVKIDGAVITIPAAFNQMQSEATLRAAEMAGLKKVALLQEPVAAALAAMAGTRREGHFLIYDLGGGTFDLALAEASKDGEVKILTHQGINMLGGRDFDRYILNNQVRPWLADNFDLPEDFARLPDYKRLMRVALLAAERGKIHLSQVEETHITASEEEIRMQDQAGRDIYLDVSLTRTDFEKLIQKPVEDTISLIRKLLEDANLKTENLDSVVFVGGPSRIPLIREMVSHLLKVPVDLKIDPLTTVAMGAAYHAESLLWDESAPNSLLGAVQRKPKEETVKVDKTQTGLDLSFDYSARTNADKAQVTVRLKSAPAKARWVRTLAADESWQSPLYKLEDGLGFTLPLTQTGANPFTIAVFDEQRDPLPHGEREILITRTAASAAQIPAAQTIAVKLLDRKAGENVLEALITKGTELPAEGEAVFRAARHMKSGTGQSLALELFQLEYPEKVELNLCIGVFFITGHDLPDGYTIRKGEPITFKWAMDESGILRAKVFLPAHEEDDEDDTADQTIELVTPRFYSPQAAALAFDSAQGVPFCAAMLARAEDDWGELAAAIGPEAGADIQLLHDRILDQQEILGEAGADPEIIRQVSEEARFLRQDIARAGKKYLAALLQRRSARLYALFNRIARNFANAEELERVEHGFYEIGQILNRDGEDNQDDLADAERNLEDLTDEFFELAWRDRSFVRMWFGRLKAEPFLFPDQDEFESMVEAGLAHDKDGDDEALRALVRRMFDIRVRLSASDTVSDPATLVKGD